MTASVVRTLEASVWLLLAAMLGLVPACSSSSSNADTSPAGTGNGTLPIPGPDVDVPPDIKLHPDVVVVHGGLAVLHRVSEDHSVWTLDKSAPGVASLAPGKIVLLAGLDVARVTAVVDRGDEVDLSVAGVGFAEVVTDGKLTFDKKALDPNRNVVIREPDDPSNADLATKAIPVLGHLRPLDTNSSTISLPGGWSFDWTAIPTATGGLDIAVTGTRENTVSGLKLGAIEISVSAKAHIENVSGSGSVDLTGGAVTNSDFSAPLDGYVDFAATAKTKVAGQYPSSSLIKLPISFEYPFPCAGLPCYLSVKVALSIQPSLATTDSAIGLNGHLEFGGPAGMSFSGGVATAAGAPTVKDPPDLLQQAKIVPSLGNTAMVFALQAPKVGVGLGTLAASVGFKAGVFVDVVNSFGITVAGATAPLPCQTMNWIVASHGGGEMTIKLFEGVSVDLQHQVELGKKTKDWTIPNVSSCHP